MGHVAIEHWFHFLLFAFGTTGLMLHFPRWQDRAKFALITVVTFIDLARILGTP